MAKFVPLLGELSGSIGNNTFSHNKGGAYARRRAIPTNPNSTKQQSARTILATLSGAWAGLSSTNQAAWNDYAALNPVTDALGQSTLLSGQQAYVGLNCRLLQSGASRVDTAPVGNGPAQLTGVLATWTSTSTLAVGWTSGPLGAAEKLVIWTTLPGTAGRNPNLKQARQIGFSSVAQATPFTLTSPYPALPNQVANLFVGRIDSAGRLSVLTKVRVTAS